MCIVTWDMAFSDGGLGYSMGALDEMSHVKFKKFCCPPLQIISCPMSPLRWCHVTHMSILRITHLFLVSPINVPCCISILRNVTIVVSRLGFKRQSFLLRNTLGVT